MDKQILKFKEIVRINLNRDRQYIDKIWGKPKKKSDNEVWFFNRFSFSLFRDEITFTFEEDIVIDICLTRFFLWIEVKCIFYLEGQNPEYKIVSLF